MSTKLGPTTFRFISRLISRSPQIPLSSISLTFQWLETIPTLRGRTSSRTRGGSILRPSQHIDTLTGQGSNLNSLSRYRYPQPVSNKYFRHKYQNHLILSTSYFLSFKLILEAIQCFEILPGTNVIKPLLSVIYEFS